MLKKLAIVLAMVGGVMAFTGCDVTWQDGCVQKNYTETEMVGWDYVGSDPGHWEDANNVVKGYAGEEDGFIWATSDCAGLPDDQHGGVDIELQDHCIFRATTNNYLQAMYWVQDASPWPGGNWYMTTTDLHYGSSYYSNGPIMGNAPCAEQHKTWASVGVGS